MSNINYEEKYREIYINVSEFVLSVQKIVIYKNYAIPLINKIIKNYQKFRIKIDSPNERRACDEYMKSLKKLVEIMKKKISSYEKYREEQLDII